MLKDIVYELLQKFCWQRLNTEVDAAFKEGYKLGYKAGSCSDIDILEAYRLVSINKEGKNV